MCTAPISLSGRNAVNRPGHAFLFTFARTFDALPTAANLFRIIIGGTVDHTLAIKRNVRIFWHVVFETDVGGLLHATALALSYASTAFMPVRVLWAILDALMVGPEVAKAQVTAHIAFALVLVTATEATFIATFSRFGTCPVTT